ncbi:MAG: AAA family ATPase [Gemmatimonadales bacterium]|nr:AAA family ATPase [Gemmatimonadales bacterium]
MGVDDAHVEVLALADLLEHPELLRPPPVVVPYFAWQGRLTMLAGAEKVGKSTVIGQAVAAISRGLDFLDQRAPAVNVLYVALDEPLADLVRRLHGYGARMRVFIVRERPGMAELIDLLKDREIGLVIIDTAAEFATGLVDDFNSAAQWTPLLKALRGALEQTGCAGVLLHHTTRAGDRYADSRALGAGVDVILTMIREGDDGTVRKVKAMGRVPVADFRLRFDGQRYELEGGELPLQTRVYRAIAAQPGIGSTKLREAVGGATKDVTTALHELLRTRVVEDRGEGSRRSFHVVPMTLTNGEPGDPSVRGLVRGASGDVSPLSQRQSGVSQGSSQGDLTGPYSNRGAESGQVGALVGDEVQTWRECEHTVGGYMPPKPWKDDAGIWHCGHCEKPPLVMEVA